MNNRLGIAPTKLYQNMSEGKLAIYIKSQFIKARGIKSTLSASHNIICYKIFQVRI